MTFNSNKKIKSDGSRGRKWSCFPNYIEAPNNDGPNKLNGATFSTKLVERLLDMYAPPGSIVYDSFMGTGTTAVACKKKGYSFIGSELSDNQVKYANERLTGLLRKENKKSLF